MLCQGVWTIWEMEKKCKSLPGGSMDSDLAQGEREDGRSCRAVGIAQMDDDMDLNLSNDRVTEEEGLNLRDSSTLGITNVGDQLNV